MNSITQEARKRQAVVKTSIKKGKSYASRMYGVVFQVSNGGANAMTEIGGH